MYRRDELTNTPNVNAASALIPVWSSATERFARDVDNTFTDEWGNLASYTGSNWEVYSYYWVSETHTDTTRHLGVNIGYGFPYYTGIVPTDGLVCRGE